MNALRSSDSRFTPVRVDGQALLLPTGDLLTQLIQDPQLDGRPVGHGSILRSYSELAKRISELHVAVGSPLEAGKPWWVYQLVQVAPQDLRRVRVETVRCGCGASLMVGNHLDFNAYIGCDEPLTRLQGHQKESRRTCPSCESALTLPAIWVHVAERSPAA